VELAQIPVQTPEGELRLQAAIVWPLGARPEQPRPTIVFSHGSPMTVAAREGMTPLGSSWAIQWFVARGYVVVAALRHGFGTSEGRFSEGVDREHHDYAQAGRVAAADIRAALTFTQALAGVDPERIVLAGHSAGGFGSLALASEDVRVRGVISFAGGKGAQLLGAGPPYTTAIAAAAGEYGKTARVPSLWIYAANDQWFAPPIATAMFDAYRSAGGPAEIVRLPALGADGHGLFTGEAVQLWTKPVEEFLRRIGMG
jgi:dienelactone hydrolase